MGFLGGIPSIIDPEEERKWSLLQARQQQPEALPTLQGTAQAQVSDSLRTQPVYQPSEPISQTRADITAAMPSMPSVLKPRPQPSAPVSLPKTPGNEFIPPDGPDNRNYIEQSNDSMAQRSALAPRPTPISPAEQNLARPMGINAAAIAGQRSAPAAPLAPLAQARNEIGPQKHRGFFRTLGDVALGLAGGGVGGAILGGFKGGDWRYQQQLGQRAGEIGEQQAYDRQHSADALNAENIRADNARQASLLNARQPTIWKPDTVVGKDGKPMRVLINENTGEIRETGYGAEGNGKDEPEVYNPEHQRRASELSAQWPRNAKGQLITTVKGKYGDEEKVIDESQRDQLIRDRLEKEHINPYIKQSLLSSRQAGSGQPTTPTPAPTPISPQPAPAPQPTPIVPAGESQPNAQPFVSPHQQQSSGFASFAPAPATPLQPSTPATSRPGIAKASGHSDPKVSAVEARFGVDSPQAQRARELMAILNRKKKH